MITITEKITKKTIGDTSLFIEFPFNQRIVDIVKSADSAVWLKKDKLWEVPLNNLSYLIDNLTYMDDIELNLIEISTPSGLSQVLRHKTKMYDYQVEGVDWMLNHPNGLVLDPPGLGKTIMSIYTAEELKEQVGIEHCLILCGINTLKHNWESEIKKHSDLSSIIIGERVNSKGNIVNMKIPERADQLYNKIDEFFVIMNVESLRDSLVVDAILNSKNNFDMIVFDEVHKCKSSNSTQGENLLKISKVGKYHYGLTGTLLVNSPLDAYVPLKFIGKERSTLTNFKRFFCDLGGKYSKYQVNGYRNLDILSDEINSCSIRRPKSLLDLPPKIIIPEIIDMSDAQSKFYNELVEKDISEVDRVNIKTTSLLGMVTRFRQAATCPSVLTTNDILVSKIERAVDLVNEIVSSGEKVVIFSTFKEPLNILYDRLAEYKPLLATGDLSDVEINCNKNRFQEGEENKVFLATTSMCGTGITLTAATYEIFIDSTWTAALEEQCQDRCWRIGTKKSVTVYNLIARGTIDERIQMILENKRNMADEIIKNSADKLDRITVLSELDAKADEREEIKLLLK